MHSCSTSTPINHVFFFLQNTSCIRKPQVISGGGGGRGGAHPLHPPTRSAPGWGMDVLPNCLFLGIPCLDRMLPCSSVRVGQPAEDLATTGSDVDNPDLPAPQPR